jgi:hypothetical protein
MESPENVADRHQNDGRPTPGTAELKFATLLGVAQSKFQISKPHWNHMVSSDPFESEVRSRLSAKCDELRIRVTRADCS